MAACFTVQIYLIAYIPPDFLSRVNNVGLTLDYRKVYV